MMASADPQLHCVLKKRFHSQTQDFVLDVDLSIGAEIAVIFGPSGAGKTTILECIAGLLKPDHGRVELNGKELVKLPIRERQLGYVFQDSALFPHMTARQNIGYGLQQLPPRDRESSTAEILEAFHIAHVAARRPAEMSGGERQRVALARALVTRPQALLLDEPMSALDYDTKSGILRDLRTWHSQHRIPVIYVTHALDEVFAIADRVLQIENGKIVAEGKPAEILGEQRDLLIRELQAR
jgi:molybdate transport system ATP-binding protein